MKSGLKPLSSMSERKQKFVELYAESGDQKQAYLDAGYNPGKKAHAANARALARELKPYLEEAFHDRIHGRVPKAIKTLEHLMLNAKSEQVRLKATMDILDRSGYKEAQKIEITDLTAVDMDNTELDAHIAKLAIMAGDKLKVIKGGKS